MGERVDVKCKVKAVGAFSAHGDQKKMLSWIGSSDMPPKNIYLNHGETDAMTKFAEKIKENFNIEAKMAERNFIIEI
jgi:metallo-beta-lactamase family protein